MFQLVSFLKVLDSDLNEGIENAESFAFYVCLFH